jgi:FkbM family methyltransferase
MTDTSARLFSFCVRRMPRPIVRRLARLPALRRWVLPRVAESLSSRDLTIPRGLARGLTFRPGRSNWPGYAAGTTEPLVQEALAAHLEPGAVFYDIGANVGFFTLIAARLVGPGGWVRSFEPHPETAEVLQHNLTVNNFENVEIVRAAVGAEPGTGKIAGNMPLTFHLADEGVEVPVVTLDEVVASYPPTLIKIDVEGAEIDVLKGAEQTLLEYRPVIVCEVHATASECSELLTVARYEIVELERDAGGLPHLLALPERAV